MAGRANAPSSTNSLADLPAEILNLMQPHLLGVRGSWQSLRRCSKSLLQASIDGHPGTSKSDAAASIAEREAKIDAIKADVPKGDPSKRSAAAAAVRRVPNVQPPSCLPSWFVPTCTRSAPCARCADMLELVQPGWTGRNGEDRLPGWHDPVHETILATRERVAALDARLAAMPALPHELRSVRSIDRAAKVVEADPAAAPDLAVVLAAAIGAYADDLPEEGRTGHAVRPTDSLEDACARVTDALAMLDRHERRDLPNKCALLIDIGSGLSDSLWARDSGFTLDNFLWALALRRDAVETRLMREAYCFALATSAAEGMPAAAAGAGLPPATTMRAEEALGCGIVVDKLHAVQGKYYSDLPEQLRTLGVPIAEEGGAVRSFLRRAMLPCDRVDQKGWRLKPAVSALGAAQAQRRQVRLNDEENAAKAPPPQQQSPATTSKRKARMRTYSAAHVLVEGYLSCATTDNVLACETAAGLPEGYRLAPRVVAPEEPPDSAVVNAACYLLSLHAEAEELLARPEPAVEENARGVPRRLPRRLDMMAL